MKRIIAIVFASAMLLQGLCSQVNTEKLKQLEQLEEGQEATQAELTDTILLEEEYVAAGEDEEIFIDEPEQTDTFIYEDGNTLKIGKSIVIEEYDDSVTIQVGKREVVLKDNGNETTIDINNKKKAEKKEWRRKNFDSHLAGVELGFNGYLNNDWIMSLDPAYSYLDLNTTKSSCLNVLLPNISLGITRHFGFAGSLGLSFNNYRFDGNNTIDTDDNGLIGVVYPVGVTYSKSKLATVYAILPVILELQIPVSHGSTLNIGAGVIGGVKLGSHTKVVYFDDSRQKEKNRDDFSLNLFRYGLTARVGYEMVQIFGTCYLSEMFEYDKGPVLHPFEVGIALSFND